MNEQTIRNLLQQVYTIRRKYNEIAQLTGERFNIFKVLDVSTQEVRMHSALLGELLHPKGSHGCGDVFLNYFLEQQKRKYQVYYSKLDGFKSGIALVKVEHHIPGGISADKTEGGRIDILVIAGNDQIIIENKIYAGDQNNQLIRYHNYDKAAPIFYLTLDGKSPSLTSCEDKPSGVCLQEGVDFVCISYKEDIIEWLQSCLKETVNLPLLRETIQQYIYLIKSLTYQTINHKMKDEIIKAVMENDDYLESAFTISNITKQIAELRAIELTKQIAQVVLDKKLPCTVSQYFHKFPRLEYYPNGWKNHLIGFTDENGFMFGIKRVKDTMKTLQAEDVKPVIGNDWKTSNWWLCYKAHDFGCFNLLSAEPWLKKNESEVVNTIIQQIELFITQINSLPEEKKSLM